MALVGTSYFVRPTQPQCILQLILESSISMIVIVLMPYLFFGQMSEKYLVSLSFTGSLGARSYPLSYVYSGRYYWDTGRLYGQTIYGLYWSSSIANNSNNYGLHMASTRLIKANTNDKRSGNALRCVFA